VKGIVFAGLPCILVAVLARIFFLMVIGIPQHNGANKLALDLELVHEQQSYRTFEFSFLK
jgi:hypothetical protein